MKAIEFEWTDEELRQLTSTDRSTGADAPGKEPTMAETIPVDLSKGGVVTVVLGKGYEIPTEYAFDPRVHVVDGASIDPRNEGWVPSTTRIVIHTDHIPEKTYQYLSTIMRQRRLVYLPRKSKDAIKAELDKLLPKRSMDAKANGNGGNGKTHEPEPVNTDLKLTGKGSVIGFCKAHADLSKGSGVEGRRLFVLAQAHGLKTTLGSLTQGVAVLKRRAGKGDIPASAQPAQGAGTIVFTGIQHAIEELTRIQAAAEILEKDKAAILAENAELKARVELMKSAWKDL